MAKVYIERAYIEDCEPVDSHRILIHIKENNNHIFVGEVNLSRQIPWIHLDTDKNGDLMINNSAGMENNKWDHITKDIIDNG